MKHDAATLIRQARRNAEVSQAELARRLGTTQSAVARLERPGSNPRLDTLDRALRETGHRLEISAIAYKPSFDPTLITSQLRMTPAQRLRTFEAFEHDIRALQEAGRRAREHRP